MLSRHAFIPTARSLTLSSTFSRSSRVFRCHPRSQHTLSPHTAPKRHIVLLSGGVESTTLLHLSARDPLTHITALFFDYGQRAALHERHAAQHQCSLCGVDDFVTANLHALTATFNSRSGERRHVPLQHRNGVLLAVATSLAAQDGAQKISLAVCKDDEEWYPSARPAFVDAFRGVLQALGGEICVEAPLQGMRKAEVVREGIKAGVDFEGTWSCMIGRGEVHCGRCVQCRARKRAFEEAGVVEREGFYAR